MDGSDGADALFSKLNRSNAAMKATHPDVNITVKSYPLFPLDTGEGSWLLSNK